MRVSKSVLFFLQKDDTLFTFIIFGLNLVQSVYTKYLHKAKMVLFFLNSTCNLGGLVLRASRVMNNKYTGIVLGLWVGGFKRKDKKIMAEPCINR